MTRMPAIFFGHGSPMVALERSDVTRAWRAIAQRIGKPRAIVCVSAHWMTRGTAVTAMAQPRTIHAFGAFTQALFAVRYPAPGDPELAWIGRASCRERVGQYVCVSVVAVSVKKKIK